MNALAPEMQKALKLAQALGQNGDSLLVHINKREAALLDKVTDGASVNPKTGLLAFDDGDWSSAGDWAGSAGSDNWNDSWGGSDNWGRGESGGKAEGGFFGDPSNTDPAPGPEAFQLSGPGAPGNNTYGETVENYENFLERTMGLNLKDQAQQMYATGPQDKGALANFMASPTSYIWDTISNSPTVMSTLGSLAGLALAGPFGAALGSFAGGKIGGMGTGEALGTGIGGLAGGALGAGLGLGITGGIAGSYGGGKLGASFDDEKGYTNQSVASGAGKSGAHGTGVSAGENPVGGGSSPQQGTGDNAGGYDNSALAQAMMGRVPTPHRFVNPRSLASYYG